MQQSLGTSAESDAASNASQIATQSGRLRLMVLTLRGQLTRPADPGESASVRNRYAAYAPTVRTSAGTFTVFSWAGSRTVNTGHGADRTTRSATLPMKK